MFKGEIQMQVEISRRKFLQGSVALSVLGGSATTFSTLIAEEKNPYHSMPK